MHVQDTPAAVCCKFNQTVLPQTLIALREGTNATEIGQDFEELALIGTQFEDALITTHNSAAFISGQGGYGALQRADMPLRLSRSSKRVDVRFNSENFVQLVRTDASATETSSIAVCNHLGQVQHRVQYVTEFDQTIAGSLAAQPYVTAPTQYEKPAENVISLALVRSARDEWRRRDIGYHLNDYLTDGGRNRACVLPYVDSSLAWQILPEVLSSFLMYLCNRRISHARLVCGCGMLQADVSRVETLDTFGAVLLGRSPQKSFSIDMSKIGAAWVTVHKGTWLLELFDDDGFGIAIFAADPMENTKNWNELLCSLPQQPGCK